MNRDLLHGQEVKDLVRDAYRHVPATTAAVAHKIYTPEELADVPGSAISRALGVANHLPYAPSIHRSFTPHTRFSAPRSHSSLRCRAGLPPR